MWESKFYGAFVLNHRVVLHAIDASPARWRGDAGSSPLDRARTGASSPRNDFVKNCRVHPTDWLISTQAEASAFFWAACFEAAALDAAASLAFWEAAAFASADFFFAAAEASAFAWAACFAASLAF